MILHSTYSFIHSSIMSIDNIFQFQFQFSTQNNTSSSHSNSILKYFERAKIHPAVIVLSSLFSIICIIFLFMYFTIYPEPVSGLELYRYQTPDSLPEQIYISRTSGVQGIFKTLNLNSEIPSSVPLQTRSLQTYTSLVTSISTLSYSRHHSFLFHFSNWRASNIQILEILIATASLITPEDQWTFVIFTPDLDIISTLNILLTQSNFPNIKLYVYRTFLHPVGKPTHCNGKPTYLDYTTENTSLPGHTRLVSRTSKSSLKRFYPTSNKCSTLSHLSLKTLTQSDPRWLYSLSFATYTSTSKLGIFFSKTNPRLFHFQIDPYHSSLYNLMVLGYSFPTYVSTNFKLFGESILTLTNYPPRDINTLDSEIPAYSPPALAIPSAFSGKTSRPIHKTYQSTQTQTQNIESDNPLIPSFHLPFVDPPFFQIHLSTVLSIRNIYPSAPIYIHAPRHSLIKSYVKHPLISDAIGHITKGASRTNITLAFQYLGVYLRELDPENPEFSSKYNYIDPMFSTIQYILNANTQVADKSPAVLLQFGFLLIKPIPDAILLSTSVSLVDTRYSAVSLSPIIFPSHLQQNPGLNVLYSFLDDFSQISQIPFHTDYSPNYGHPNTESFGYPDVTHLLSSRLLQVSSDVSSSSTGITPKIIQKNGFSILDANSSRPLPEYELGSMLLFREKLYADLFPSSWALNVDYLYGRSVRYLHYITDLSNCTALYCFLFRSLVQSAIN